MDILGWNRDKAGNIGANNLTLSISLEEGLIQSPAVRTATRDAALAASSGTVAVLSVGAVSATTITPGALSRKSFNETSAGQNFKTQAILFDYIGFLLHESTGVLMWFFWTFAKHMTELVFLRWKASWSATPQAFCTTCTGLIPNAMIRKYLWVQTLWCILLS